ncbi:hypothetical protein [Alistipes sp. ZOR0009]|jgi:hypothetical protein|uniref:hypothetical protein n=1 Tax=Alistipes sp. ZOR0009 TaxID=1339253 RepID=UPI0006464D9E|nr:hypothetical protein [Alistipes sp. ZOR0009]
MKIDIPGHPDNKANLAAGIIAKHEKDGEASPIKLLVTPDVKVNVDKITSKTKQAVELRRQSEVLIEERNNLVKDVDQFIRGCRDILMALYPDEPKKLTEYGFDVVTNPSKSKGSEDK